MDLVWEDKSSVDSEEQTLLGEYEIAMHGSYSPSSEYSGASYIGTQCSKRFDIFTGVLGPCNTLS